MPTRSPTWPEVLDRLREKIMQELHVALPAQVESYDPSTQLASVKPLIQDVFYDEDDSLTSISLPVITNVPVLWPSGGGFGVTCPLAAGDTVTVLFHDRSLDAWLAQGSEQAPEDLRRHALKDAVAIPGCWPKPSAMPGVPSDGAQLGRMGGLAVKVTTSHVQLGNSATDVAVLGNALHSYLGQLVTDLTVFATGLSPSTLTGQAAALVTALGTALSALDVYRSNTVKVQP
jgi:hypothetical protein